MEDIVQLAIGLGQYIHNANERQIHVVRGDEIDGLETASLLKIKQEKGKLQNWEDKVLHEQMSRQAKKLDVVIEI